MSASGASQGMRGLLVLAFALMLAPATVAGTASQPDVADAAGDVAFNGQPAPHPCADAIDLLSFWVEWVDGGVAFHYAFADLGALAEPPVQDVAGRCFYSYADFVLERADGTALEESLYVDYTGNPAYETGWRFYLHESREEAAGVVDLDAGTIDVVVPLGALGGAGPGDSIGAFWVQAASALVGLGVDYAGDFAPDAGACDCSVPFPGEPATTDGAGAGPDAEPQVTAPSSSPATGSAEPAGASSAGAPGAPDAEESGRDGTTTKESPGAFGALAVALALGLVALRRRA